MTTAADWSGAVGDIWAAEWRRTDRSFAGFAPHLDGAILAAAPATGKAIDLGCGAGATSIALATARPDLTVTGIDLSFELVRIARDRGAGLPNLSFAVADIAADPARIAEGADLLFSRHGVMFFPDPAAVFARLRAAVNPGARLVFSCFRSSVLNPWATALVTAVTGDGPVSAEGYAPGPFGFADDNWTRAILAQAGWQDIGAEAVDYHYIAGEGADPISAAAAFFRRVGPVSAALRAAPEADRPDMLVRLVAALAAYRDGDRVSFPAAAWLWTARA